MTNPDNAVGTNAAYGGRTSVNAFNDNLAVYSRGIMSGWACAPSTGLTVVLGGNGNIRDVAVAEDNAGNKTTINNISGSPVSVTLESAPASNSRIDAIVAYVDNPPQGTSTIVDNYEACGIIAVTGSSASSPVVPTDNAIRTAITADGASGATAYYVVLATIAIAAGTTDITVDNITTGVSSVLQPQNISSDIFSFGDYSTNEMDTKSTWVDGKKIYKKTIDFGSLPNATAKTVNHGISNLGFIIKVEAYAHNQSGNDYSAIPIVSTSGFPASLAISNSAITVTTTSDRTVYATCYITLYYTKNN